MKIDSTRRMDAWDMDAQATNQIIYIGDHRKAGLRKKNKNNDTFWNVLFVAACVSVLVVLFLH